MHGFSTYQYQFILNTYYFLDPTRENVLKLCIYFHFSPLYIRSLCDSYRCDLHKLLNLLDKIQALIKWKRLQSLCKLCKFVYVQISHQLRPNTLVRTVIGLSGEFTAYEEYQIIIISFYYYKFFFNLLLNNNYILFFNKTLFWNYQFEFKSISATVS